MDDGGEVRERSGQGESSGVGAKGGELAAWTADSVGAWPAAPAAASGGGLRRVESRCYRLGYALFDAGEARGVAVGHGVPRFRRSSVRIAGGVVARVLLAFVEAPVLVKVPARP